MDTEQNSQTLLDRINSEALDEAARIIADAERDAKSKMESVRARGEYLEKEIFERAERSIMQIRKTAESSAMMETKRIRLRIQEKQYRAILDHALKLASALPESPEYPEVLMAWLVEAACGLEREEGVVDAGERELPLIDDGFLKEATLRSGRICGTEVRLTLRKNARPVPGQGVIVTDRQGRLAWDNRIHARMKRKEQEIRRIIGETLNKEPGHK